MPTFNNSDFILIMILPTRSLDDEVIVVNARLSPSLNSYYHMAMCVGYLYTTLIVIDLYKLPIPWSRYQPFLLRAR